jgi:hypothetical protein
MAITPHGNAAARNGGWLAATIDFGVNDGGSPENGVSGLVQSQNAQRREASGTLLAPKKV